MTADDRPLGHPDARLVELLAQTEELRAAPPLRPAGSAEARLVEDFIADHTARTPSRVYEVAESLPDLDHASRGLFQGTPPLPWDHPAVADFHARVAADPTAAALRVIKWGIRQPITVEQMLNNPASIARRLAEVERTHELGRALIPPGPPLTRWQRARLAVVSRLDAARGRVALAIAPWLEDHS